MTVLLTGANGFIGRFLAPALIDAGYNVICTGRRAAPVSMSCRDGCYYVQMDFTDPFAVHDIFEKFQPGIVIHCGAMSRADECETEQWQAYLVNVEGTMNIMQNAAEHHCHLLFLSTDFIFDGIRGMYNEDDVPSPINYYGQTKLEAEDIIASHTDPWTIIRTVLVYGKALAGRSDLLNTVRAKLVAGETYNVVSDQYRTPTLVDDLVAGILIIVQNKLQGIYHVSGEEVMTPYDMAVGLADHLGLDKSLLRPVDSSFFPQAARRPMRTGFDISKMKAAGYKPHNFKKGLAISFPVSGV